MEVVILCGGKGSRLAEETQSRPKPMVEIGGKPILWHIMKHYSNFGYKKFILALGYKGDYIKNYFLKYKTIKSDFTITMNPISEPIFYNEVEDSDWEITFVNTGENNQKGSRIKQIEKYIKSDTFFVTYGDGVSNVNLNNLLDFHVKENKIVTLTAVHPPSRFGELELDGFKVTNFEEKPQMATGYINGGFFVMNKKILNYLSIDPDCDLEFGALQKLSKENELNAYFHNDFWQCMDNIREKEYLDKLANTNQIPWFKTTK
jgi:glucose-1-phosphate cytidylyltransferase